MPELETLREKVAANSFVAKAYLVRKQVRYFTDRPVYVLGITFRFLLSARTPATVITKMAEGIPAPRGCMVFISLDSNPTLRRPIKAQKDCCIYRRVRFAGLRERLRGAPS